MFFFENVNNQPVVIYLNHINAQTEHCLAIAINTIKSLIPENGVLKEPILKIETLNFASTVYLLDNFDLETDSDGEIREMLTLTNQSTNMVCDEYVYINGVPLINDNDLDVGYIHLYVKNSNRDLLFIDSSRYHDIEDSENQEFDSFQDLEQELFNVIAKEINMNPERLNEIMTSSSLNMKYNDLIQEKEKNNFQNKIPEIDIDDDEIPF